MISNSTSLNPVKLLFKLITDCSWVKTKIEKQRNNKSKTETQIVTILQLCSEDLLSPLARRINRTPSSGRNVIMDKIGHDDNIILSPNPTEIPRVKLQHQSSLQTHSDTHIQFVILITC